VRKVMIFTRSFGEPNKAQTGFYEGTSLKQRSKEPALGSAG